MKIFGAPLIWLMTDPLSGALRRQSLGDNGALIEHGNNIAWLGRLGDGFGAGMFQQRLHELAKQPGIGSTFLSIYSLSTSRRLLRMPRVVAYIDDLFFQMKLAETAKANCPVSKVLNAKITMTAKLEG